MLLAFKSLGALVYGMAGGALALFGKPKTMFRVSVLLTSIAIAYPLLRSADLVPTQHIINVIQAINYERAQSLDFRFRNEDQLLEKAFQRPVFGWGRYGRSRVYDPDSGTDLSITDGRWIIDLGSFGLVGFIAEFGLLGLCVFKAAAAWPLSQSRGERLFLAILSLIVSINIFDLLPNASIIPITWLCAGTLLGQSERLLATKRRGHHSRLCRPCPNENASSDRLRTTCPISETEKSSFWIDRREKKMVQSTLQQRQAPKFLGTA